MNPIYRTEQPGLVSYYDLTKITMMRHDIKGGWLVLFTGDSDIDAIDEPSWRELLAAWMKYNSKTADEINEMLTLALVDATQWLPSKTTPAIEEALQWLGH